MIITTEREVQLNTPPETVEASSHLRFTSIKLDSDTFASSDLSLGGCIDKLSIFRSKTLLYITNAFVGRLVGTPRVKYTGTVKPDVIDIINNQLLPHVSEQVFWATICGEFLTRVNVQSSIVTNMEWLHPSVITNVVVSDTIPLHTLAVTLTDDKDHTVGWPTKGTGYLYERWIDASGLGQPRGLGEWDNWLTDIGWLDSALSSRLIADTLDHVRYWDVKLTGMSEQRIQKWLNSADAVPPTSGDLVGHNEAVEWSLRGSDVRSQRRNITEGMQDDLHYLLVLAGVLPLDTRSANEEDVLNAYALRKQAPIYKFYNSILDKLADGKAKLVLPLATVRSAQRLAGATQRLTDSLTKAVDNGWIDNETAATIYREHVISWLTHGD